MVENLAVHTTGGVVAPTQELMQIVPRDGRLEVEARVENKDIEFVLSPLLRGLRESARER